MDTGSDLINYFRLETRFFPWYTEHSRYTSDQARGLRRVKEVKQWSRERELGQGGFGDVWLEKEHGGQLRAVKEIRKRDEDSNNIDYSRELLAMAYFSREGSTFVTFEGWFESDFRVYVAMEYLEFGDLQQCVSAPVAEHEARMITFQVVEGLKTMHERGFTHRDLKPANIFVVSRSPNWWVKIGDFGISKRVREGMTSLRTRIVGDFVAPEVNNLIDEDEESDPDYTSAVDIWSLGSVTHWLLTRTVPFPNGKGLRGYCLRRKEFPKAAMEAKNTRAEAVGFITTLMAIMPQDRLTAEQALRSPWLQEVLGASLTSDGNSDTSTQALVGGSRFQEYVDRSNAQLSRQGTTTMRLEESRGERKDGSVHLLNDALEGPSFETLNEEPGASAERGIFLVPKNDRRNVPHILDEAEKGSSPAPSRVAPQTLNSGQATVSDRSDARQPPEPNIEAATVPQELPQPDTLAQILNDLKTFSQSERMKFNERRRLFRINDKEVKFQDLKNFSQNFKLGTPPPPDLLPLLGKGSPKPPPTWSDMAFGVPPKPLSLPLLDRPPAKSKQSDEQDPQLNITNAMAGLTSLDQKSQLSRMSPDAGSTASLSRNQRRKKSRRSKQAAGQSTVPGNDAIDPKDKGVPPSIASNTLKLNQIDGKRNKKT